MFFLLSDLKSLRTKTVPFSETMQTRWMTWNKLHRNCQHISCLVQLHACWYVTHWKSLPELPMTSSEGFQTTKDSTSGNFLTGCHPDQTGFTVCSDDWPLSSFLASMEMPLLNTWFLYLITLILGVQLHHHLLK